jgi:pyruvate dehydrogenase E2 component (dihydrolipoamide acetyltransferase)
MANDIVMPRLGWTMESGRLVEWFKQDGEEVAAGELLFAVETDKAIQEVEALDSGVLHIPSDSPLGEEAPVGALLGYILAPGEAAPTETGTAAQEPVAVQADGPAISIVAEAEAIAATAQGGVPAISPRAKRVAAELGVDWVVLAGSGSTGRIVERDIRAAAGAQPVAADAVARGRATPSVKRMANEQGVDLAAVAGSAPGGRVTRGDIANAAKNGRGENYLPAASHLVIEPDDQVTPISAVRRITALRMAEAAHTVAPVTLTTEIDATELVGTRARLKADLAAGGETVPTITDMLAKLTALALTKHSEMNCALDGESIVQHASVHIGIAVDGERGLFAPVIRNADRKSLFTIAEESTGLIASARAGSLAPDLMSGSTFTITNLGMFGVDAFTPILNLPEAAILGVGRIVAKPVVIDEETEEIAVRKMLTLSLTFDHRSVDGAPAARFLQSLSRMIERPASWLMR